MSGTVEGTIDSRVLAERLSGLGAVSGALLAVSGGADSIALLHLAAPLARPDFAIAVATVDHGLRPESASEAAFVGQQSRDLGLPHQVLRWAGSRPSSGIQAAARRARYRLLAEHARNNGLDAVVTAHTADDQAETVFMRLSRGSGPAGLAGMAQTQRIAAGAGAPVLLLRPLLDVSRSALRSIAGAMPGRFIDDPANLDSRFERVRIRALLAALEQQALLTRNALVLTAERQRKAAAALRRNALEAFAGSGGEVGEDAIDLPHWKDAPPTLIAYAVLAAGAGDYLPDDQALTNALDALERGGAATLAGALLRADHMGRLRVCREPSALLGRGGEAPARPVPIVVGAPVLWDARFRVTLLRAGASACHVIPEGQAERSEEVRQTRPVVVCGEERLAPSWFAVESLLRERFFDPVIRYGDD